MRRAYGQVETATCASVTRIEYGWGMTEQSLAQGHSFWILECRSDEHHRQRAKDAIARVARVNARNFSYRIQRIFIRFVQKDYSNLPLLRRAGNTSGRRGATIAD